MTIGIYGLFGVGERSWMAAMGQRLSHRGAFDSIGSPAPDVHLGCRAPSPQISWGGPAKGVPLVFSGAITNRDEIARLLRYEAQVPGSDAELAWNLYSVLGPASFARINGQFALALFDAAAGELVLAADRWAARTTYVTRVSGGWAFASEYKALFCIQDVTAKLNPTAAAVLERTKYLPADLALPAGVRCVGPGEYLRISRGGLEAHSYEPLKLEIATESSERELASQLRDTILTAALNLTKGLDRVGIALSAGLDSTLTLGAVRTVAPDKLIHTYTAGFDSQDPDLALAAESARHFGTIHHEIILQPEHVPALLAQMVRRMEDPVAREEMLVYCALSQQAARDVPIVLYGHMSDVLFGGMPRHLLVKAASELPFFKNPIGEFYDYTQTGQAPRSLLGRALVMAYFRGGRTAPPRIIGAPDDLNLQGLHLEANEPLNAVLLEATRHLTEVSAMERLHAWAGLDFGSIFHDRDVAQCAFRIPGRLKIRGRCRKYILRQAAAGILPGHLAARPKGMIRMSRNPRLTRAIGALCAGVLSPEAVARRGLFDGADVRRLLRPGRGGRYTQDQFYHLWSMLLIELWCRIFLEGRSDAGAWSGAELRQTLGLPAHSRTHLFHS